MQNLYFGLKGQKEKTEWKEDYLAITIAGKADSAYEN